MNFEFTNFKSFLDVIQSITKESLKEAQKLLETTGKDIKNLDDIFINDNGELFELLPDGSLVRVNLYIATNSYNISQNMVESLKLYNNYEAKHTYHIYKCRTLVEKFGTNGRDRYKINTRNNGTFYYIVHTSDNRHKYIIENQKLKICGNCITLYNNKYNTHYTKDNFNLKEFHNKKTFFDINTKEFERGEYAKPNAYSKNWSMISNQIKNKKNFTCEKCGFYPKSDYQKKFIHTHHLNGDKTNNFIDNLKVLCIKCHSDEAYHSHIKKLSDYIEFIENY